MATKRRNRSGYSDNNGPMHSMTFGVMPSRKDFARHFDFYVPMGVYRIRNDRLVGDADLTERETYDLVKRFSKSPKEEKWSLASAIMQTLGYEWI